MCLPCRYVILHLRHLINQNELNKMKKATTILLTLLAAVLTFTAMAQEDGSAIQAKVIINGYFFTETPEVNDGGSSSIIMVDDGQKNRMIAYIYPSELPESITSQAIPVEKVFHGQAFLDKYNQAREMIQVTSQSSDLAKPVVGEPFPAFSEKDVDGKMWTNEDVKGKVWVLNMWYQGCGPCRKEMPELSTWREQFPDVMFFSATYHDEALTRKITEQHHFTWTHLIEARDMMSWIQGQGFPLTIVVDKQGIVRHLVHGTNSEKRAAILDCIRQLNQ